MIEERIHYSHRAALRPVMFSHWYPDLGLSNYRTRTIVQGHLRAFLLLSCPSHSALTLPSHDIGPFEACMQAMGSFVLPKEHKLATRCQGAYTLLMVQ